MSRILYVLDYLSRNTDAEKGATLKDIQAYLLNQTNAGSVSTLSIQRDIDQIDAMGYTVDIRKGAHNTSYYHMRDRGFTFNEIRFLVDSVSINKFLSNAQKQRLFRHWTCWTIWNAYIRSLRKSGKFIFSTASITSTGKSNTMTKSGI